MSSRRKSREAALKILYQAEFSPNENIGEKAAEYFRENLSDADQREFAEILVEGVTERKTEIDERLGKALKNWELSRLGYIERAILRLGAFEIIYQPVTPDKVAINEAIELAKTFCQGESASLINGALDYTMKEKKRNGQEDKSGNDSEEAP
ncbi:Transcription termination protein NusB [hydrothermal vent metagenome]|uniref:Transcription termination protein NusB n=1 Tax=hydrothermal vent metagenome TaxID=652676 RepID=A0A3B1BW16_9ZZZZ